MGCRNFGQGVQLLLHEAGDARAGRALLFCHLCVRARRGVFCLWLAVLRLDMVSGVGGATAFLLPGVLGSLGAGTGGGLGG